MTLHAGGCQHCPVGTSLGSKDREPKAACRPGPAPAPAWPLPLRPRARWVQPHSQLCGKRRWVCGCGFYRNLNVNTEKSALPLVWTVNSDIIG